MLQTALCISQYLPMSCIEYIHIYIYIWKQMWELDCEEGWAPKNWCFWTVVLVKTLEGPMDCSTPGFPVHPRAYSNSCPFYQWCHQTISSSVVPFPSCLQSFPASGSFQMSQLFMSGGQSTGVSASTSVLLMNTQDWSPLGWTGWISLQSKGLSRVFSDTTVQKHQFFGAQLSL